MTSATSNDQSDPLAIALEAINDFDRSQLAPAISSAGTPIVPARDLYRRAALRVAYAQAAELRRQTSLLDSIETWLIGIAQHLETVEETER